MKVYNCDSCNHSTSILPDDLNEIYEKNYFIKTHKNWFDNPAIDLFDKIFNEIKALTNNKFKSILDVGCGTGSFLKHLYKHDNQLDLTGIDFITNKHKHIKFLADDFLTMGLYKKI